MLNVKKIDMTSFFIMAPKIFFFEILSTLARYSASGFHIYIKTGIYLILYPTKQIKTELKNLFSFRRDSICYIYFFKFFSNFLHFVITSTIGY